MSVELNMSHVAVVRGVSNCGEHHEENETTPAIEFARKCGPCAGKIFGTIWNAAIQAHLQFVLETVKRHR